MRSVTLAATTLVALTVAAAPISAQVSPFGSSSGLQFTLEDWLALQAASEKLYTQPAPVVGSVEKWENPTTGAFGSVLLTNVYEQQGLPCRQLQHDFKLPTNPASKRFIFIRCQVDDGSWKLFD